MNKFLFNLGEAIPIAIFTNIVGLLTYLVTGNGPFALSLIVALSAYIILAVPSIEAELSKHEELEESIDESTEENSVESTCYVNSVVDVVKAANEASSEVEKERIICGYVQDCREAALRSCDKRVKERLNKGR